MKHFGVLSLLLLLTGCAAPAVEATTAITETPVHTAITATATDSFTPTAEPSITPVPTETSAPTATVIPTITENEDWVVLSEMIEGVEMVLVPPGCFMMGSDLEDADENERPAHQICYDEAFWIDRYEVTNAVFGSEGMVAGDLLPRDTVTLPEAMEHCAARGARVPTEAEWEYAARGPSNWLYPWGDEYDAERLVTEENAGGQSQPVGSRPTGASWVGAMDMSGNLWEWTTTIYAYTYPYDADDGRENDVDMSLPRAIRGGSWDNGFGWHRTFERKDKHPTAEWYGYVGFRCVK